MFWSEIPPAVLYGLAALTIPESPRYLVARGRNQEARHVLAKVVGGDVHAKVQEIAQTVLTERKPQFSDLLSRSGGLLPIVWVGMGLSILQQFVGINVIFYYSSILWRSVGFSERNSLLITVITSIVNIVTTLIAIATVDKFGRKPLLLLGSIGMTVTLGTLAVVFGNAAIDPATGNPTLPGLPGIIALIAANLYVVFFGFSWGPIVWVMLGEMFSDLLLHRIRDYGVGFPTSRLSIPGYSPDGSCTTYLEQPHDLFPGRPIAQAVSLPHSPCVHGYQVFLWKLYT
jgi:SP family sugar:H+ symporter-like MFS transporter